MIKRALLLILTFSSFAFAQGPVVIAQTGGTIVGGAPGAAGNVFFATKGTGATVQGAPYSATITNDAVQTLADGNRIVQTSSGMIARDSQGRTRQDTMLPQLGNLSAANAPHIVFLQDPVSQTAYTLNLTDKTAQKMSIPAPGVNGAAGVAVATSLAVGTKSPLPGVTFLPPPQVTLMKVSGGDNSENVTTEDLGSQTMEGIFVTGIRNTSTIPAGQIGNDQPIQIVTEVWTSPDLKTIVYSKHSDPRIGEQTYKLTNINRAEPDLTQFIVPADFKISDGPQPILYQKFN
jgi:hypothetical protein